jgi:hypothetical protein
MRRNTGLRILIPALAAIGGAFIIFGISAAETGSGLNLVDENESAFEPSERWRAYWYQGKAEVSSFQLSQARYGQIHEGDAVTVFVTENFSPSSLTKADGLPGPSIPVLKCNFDKKFITGIYPYSMMMTIASPVNLTQSPHALKLATSSQEWCGHTYFQCNWKGKDYEWTEHSYFPQEGDRNGKIKAALLEDELWTQIRIAPQYLPQGDHWILPSSFYLRLKHQPVELKKANLKLETMGDSLQQYSIRYADGSRTLNIRFDIDFPHLIQGWDETYEDGFGEGAKPLQTVAVRKNTLMTDYWTKNGVQDTSLRRELGL